MPKHLSQKQREQLDGYRKEVETLSTNEVTHDPILLQLDVDYWKARALKSEHDLIRAENALEENSTWNTVDINDLRTLARIYKRSSKE